ncbi:rfaE bifunctional protein, domain I/rfaE bifunctional protein, domain II [Quadrisphaera granulorum]|uniref:RfaE bifunctional protein kinase chain/domain/rfaE bifunctional protein nucleotidyltransferase chain/domain n=1 Tax=Quadrisphaera granulorum TaxID=317664 RepID=A0A316A7H0_9ACTN|nr:PfkB family carbohydrate kinase [Quadrisphaera granulorum]PWJ53821.1 rfaE bifunctional protein kinase chain/domain/rfaE bifunctional protein nucleotidyltransferase chain/domain [Quadrisphaera granulorum]SZE96578.1 rfaE bifunctional protein, domain I/rfaE bifunctional protein, domain II [Quadrisphaera granulorum]
MSTTDAPDHGMDPTPAADWLTAHRGEVEATLGGLLGAAEQLNAWGRHLAAVLGGGGRLLAAGNGGSAAEAQHLTAELVGRFVAERRPLSAIALHAETSSTTAIGNDYGAAEVFARQVQAHGRPGDVLLLLSTSGRSENVVRAAQAGRRAGLRVWALTGPGVSPLGEASDDVLRVGAPGASTSAVQEGHLVAVHALCAAVDAHLLGTTATAKIAETPAPATAVAAPAVTSEPLDLRTPADRRPRAAGARRPRPRVVVVGDAVLDRDLLGRSDRVAPDAPVPVVDLHGVDESPGGAGLTALLVAGLAQTTLVAPVADDDAGRRLRDALTGFAGADGGVEVLHLGHAGGTRTKTRVRVAGQSLVRLDEGGPGTPTDVDAAQLTAVLAQADVVLVSDYGAGTTRDPVVRAALTDVARRVPVVWDPHPRGGVPVPGCALVTPNLAEARAAASPAVAGASPDILAEHLASTWGVRGVVVTTGAQGAWLASPGTEAMFAPAAVVAGGDPCGAGDRFAASAAVSLASGRVPSEAVVAAVADASAWVAAGGASGWRAAQREAASLDDAAAAAGDGGIAAPRTAADVVARVRATGGTVVATGGCFDVLHAGHVATLEAARRLGDALVVLLNADSSVRRLKGPTRPVNDEVDRARVLAALDCVDAVVVFSEDDPRAALAELRPDVWAKGGDYGGAELPEAPLVRSWGGRVVLLPYLDGRSTTSILARGAVPAAAAD